VESLKIRRGRSEPAPAGSLAGAKNSCCGRQLENRRKAKKIVKLLGVDQSLKVMRGPGRRPLTLPPTISCSELRRTVRNLYAPGLSPVQELSIKTIQKVTDKPCSYCSSVEEGRLIAYEDARLVPKVTCSSHLERFAKAFALNVCQGWDKYRVPYIPNGNSTKENSRKAGGNWNSESFSDGFRSELVWSSGKPRVVTIYSGYNVEVRRLSITLCIVRLKEGIGFLLVAQPMSGSATSPPVARGTCGTLSITRVPPTI